MELKKTYNVVMVRVKDSTNLWARGIISKVPIRGTIPEIYLIDSQRFCENNGNLEMRACPDKFLNLKLPTYYIDVNIDLDSKFIKVAIENLIWKNQCGELSFYFTPKCINNAVYSGELTINNKTDNSIIPLKKFLKIFEKKNYFSDMKNEQFTYSIFNPLRLKCLENIFIPSGFNSNNSVNITESEIKKDSTDSQNIEVHVKKDHAFIKSLMKKRYNILSNVSTSHECQKHNDSIMIPEKSEIIKISSIIETKNQTINLADDNSNIWWSSSDDEK
ncbi:uncharacterized protein LOC112693053 isoform X2 [Sipha flava]|uniref:Uncharacterized protein LOC112693053 isoform X2 n=1 Tax=Sipha flava TaxID=143950 RepID=A0A8B8GKZ7_9HEMI|nr:uncharacterized protein LOC112693053 isoform X2 [Sipha flava]